MRVGLIRGIVAVILLCGVLLFFPYTSTIVPTWRIQVVDESGTPIPGLRVTEYWKFYRAGEQSTWSEIRATDGQGRYAFPRRTVRASFAARVFSRDLNDRLRAEPSLFILACDNSHLQEARVSWRGSKFWNPAMQEGESRLVAKPVKSCAFPF
jgi:hypothetical protein